MIQQKSVAAAQSYYVSAMARNDYYTEGMETPGRWGGRGAALLGLEGLVESDAFYRLCENRHPNRDGALTPNTKSTRTVGYDINFHAPKSISVVYELTKDERIVTAFQESVAETMRELEADTRTRVRRGKVNAERVTANLTWAEFTHFTARPVGGVPDPHLHAHCFVFNATFDETEQKWKAGQFREIQRDAPYFEAAFHSRFSHKLAELGFGITRTDQHFELAGVPASVIEKFSRRRTLIEEVAAQRGLAYDREKDGLGALTREAKTTDLSRKELRHEWIGRLTLEEKRAIATAKLQGDKLPGVTPRDAVEFAKQHHLERESVVAERQLLRTALKYGVGTVSVDAAHRAAESSSLIRQRRDERTFVTSQEVLQEEKELLAFARDGRGTCRPLVPAKQKIEREFLSAEQQAAVRHAWHSQDRVIAIRGVAGTGKTTLLQEAVSAIEKHGHKVFMFAPTAEASRGVLRDEGFASADTVARLLQDKQLQRDIRGQILLIDESGLLSTKQLHAVFRLAKESDARVILSGDSKQHHSVERGDSLRLLENYAGIVPVEVTEIRRQKHAAYKNAVAALSKGRAAEGFDQLDRLGFVRELPDDQRYQQLASDYADTVIRGRSALVIAPTHREGEEVTAHIRQQLQQQGILSEKQVRFERLKSRNWTEAERSDAARYHVGDVVQFQQNARGIKRGERLSVAEVHDGSVWLQRGKSRERLLLSLQSAKAFQVYGVEQLELGSGDRIRITANGKSVKGKHRLNNGAIFEVASVSKRGDVKLTNGWIVDRNFGHWAYGYATTSHASQGKTVSEVFIAQSSASLPASSAQQFYVSASRAKDKITIYTDDKAALKTAIQESTQRLSATELMASSQPAPATWRERATRQFERVRQYSHYYQAQARVAWQRWRGPDRTPPQQPQKESARER
jgi:conjugative relaxase-like TrwC/TraI family protein